MRRRASLWVVLTVLSGFISRVPAAQLQPGNAAIIGMHADPDDQFAWVTLVDLSPGQVLFFTDAGWFTGGFQGTRSVSDGALRFTVPPAGLRAGAVQLVNLASDPLPAGYAPVTGAVGPDLLVGTFGDQLAVFTGSESAPSFVFAVTSNATRWVTSSPNPNYSAESELYPGLLEGETAVAVAAGPQAGDELDNIRYRGISRGTRDELLAALAETANWEGSDDPLGDITNGTLPTGFEILGPALFSRGDVNASGATDIADAIRALDYLFGDSAALPCDDAADVNDDGKMDISDPISLLAYLFGGGVAPPPPFAGCGEDPSQDGLTCLSFPPCR